MKNLLEAVAKTVKGVKTELESKLKVLSEKIQSIEAGLKDLTERQKGLTLPFDPDRKWYRGQKVSCNGSEWQCLATETKSEPSTNNPDWVVLRLGIGNVQLGVSEQAFTLRLNYGGNEQTTTIPLHLPEHTGTYDPKKSYALNQEVTFHGSTWRCLVPDNQVSPGEGDQWRLVSKRGARGAPGNSISEAAILSKAELQTQLLRSELVDELNQRFTTIDTEIEGLKDAVNHA